MNFPDGLLVQGKYQHKPLVPFTPGMEVSGVVTKIGSEVTEFEIGESFSSVTQMLGEPDIDKNIELIDLNPGAEKTNYWFATTNFKNWCPDHHPEETEIRIHSLGGETVIGYELISNNNINLVTVGVGQDSGTTIPIKINGKIHLKSYSEASLLIINYQKLFLIILFT